MNIGLINTTGFDCLIIWHHELRKPKNVENKLRQFMECD